MFSWKVAKAESIASGDLMPVAIDFEEYPVEKMIDFGVVPYLLNLRERSYVAWITPVATTYPGNIMGFMDGDDQGERFQFLSTNKIQYIKAIHPAADPDAVQGNLWTTDDTITVNNLHMVVITHDTTLDPAEDPIIYLDSVISALTATGAGAGTEVDMTGNTLQVGNMLTPSTIYYLGFPGRIHSIREFGKILTQAEVNTLFAAGKDDVDSITDELIFQIFNIHTKDQAHFTDLAMGSEDRIIDNIYGLIGTPHAGPVVRIP